MKRILIAAVASGAALLGTAAVAAPAMASSGPQQAVTHLNNHPDTTDVSGPAIQPGNVWANDNATEKFTVVNTGGDTWSVTMDYVGSFHGFADPTTGAALDSNGSVKGTIQFNVTSGNQPNLKALPGQSPSDTHISDNIRLIFGPNAVISGGDTYTFTYQNGNYVQSSVNGVYTPSGDVTGH